MLRAVQAEHRTERRQLLRAWERWGVHRNSVSLSISACASMANSNRSVEVSNAGSFIVAANPAKARAVI
jgi:hypothetical protein